MKRTIRKAKLEDVIKIVRIENYCFTEPWDPEIFLGIVSSGGKMPVGSRIVSMDIIEQDCKLVGYIVWAMDQTLLEGRILNIAVEENHRRDGIGKDLLQHLIKLMKSKGIKRCMLEVRASNLPAISLYDSFGMRPVDRVYGYYSNHEDALIYQLNL